MLTALGLMSGTSLDGVDVALIETDGRQVRAFGPSSYRPYTDGERSLLRQARPRPFICPSATPGRGSCGRRNTPSPLRTPRPWRRLRRSTYHG